MAVQKLKEKSPVEGAKEKIRQYRIAAKKGDIEAQLSLALCYLNGEGVFRDEKEAVVWGKKAADAGCMPAQVFLSFCYIDGIGVEKDEKEAGNWMRKAADQGDPEARFLLGMYYEGSARPGDKEAAIECFRSAAEKGHPEAQAELDKLAGQKKAPDPLLIVSGCPSRMFTKPEAAAKQIKTKAHIASRREVCPAKLNIQKPSEQSGVSPNG